MVVGPLGALPSPWPESSTVFYQSCSKQHPTLHVAADEQLCCHPDCSRAVSTLRHCTAPSKGQEPQVLFLTAAFATQSLFQMCFPLWSALQWCVVTPTSTDLLCVTTLPLKFSPLRPQHCASWSRDAGSLNSTGAIWGGKHVHWQHWQLLCGELALPNSTLTARQGQCTLAHVSHWHQI